MKQLVILLFLTAIFCQCTNLKDPSLNFFDQSPPPSYSRLTKVLGYKAIQWPRSKQVDNATPKTASHNANSPTLLVKNVGDTAITYHYRSLETCILSKEVSIKLDSEKQALSWIRKNGGKVKSMSTLKMRKPWNYFYKKLIVVNQAGQKFECHLRKKQLEILTVYDCP